jgi:parallel beta-helix repeat protein
VKAYEGETMPKKYVLMLAILSILYFYTVSLTNFAFATPDPNRVITVNPGESIQTAINNAADGDTIIVENGIYHEWHISVNKTLTIIGRTMENTIIDGNGTADVIFHVTASNVVIENFTFQNTDISFNIQGTAIRVYRATNVKVNKVITSNNYYGIELRSSNFTKITKCRILNNTWGIYLHDKSQNNTFIGNTIANNSIGINIADFASQYNVFHHNNLINNTNQVSFSGGINYFDNGYPSGGNYWSSFTAQDLKHGPYQNETGSDGILDEHAYLPDKYPFAYPLTFIEIPIAEERFQVVASTNSTLNSCTFNSQTKSLRLFLSGIEGAIGICRITIPKGLLSCDQLNQWNITSSDKQLIYLALEDGENTYLYFTYNQLNITEIKITGVNVIPEFPNGFVTLGLIAAITLSILLRRCLKSKRELNLFNLFRF